MFKKKLIFTTPLLFIFIFLIINFCSAADDSSIKIDQIGYPADGEKIAILVANKGEILEKYFQVIDIKSKQAVYQGEIKKQPVFNKDSGDFTTPLDFSDFSKPGRYFIAIGKNLKSYDFDISVNGIYKDLFFHSMKAFYFQRCGTNLDQPYSEKWPRQLCHIHDATVLETSKYLKTTGGWHDAGDYGKKVVPGAVSVGILLKLFGRFPEELKSVNLNIPHSKILPDFLEEVKYELNWLLSMQRADGAVYHLITTKNFPPVGTMPDKDNEERYIVNVSSTATADFAASLAMAARIYSPFDAGFSKTALKAAENAWNFLKENKNIVPDSGYKDPPEINGTGGYSDNDDRDERFWAAVELYKTTGKNNYHDYIKKNYENWIPTITYPMSWQDVHTLGMFDYLSIDDRLADAKIKDFIKKDLIACADNVLNQVNNSGYRTALNSTDYYWGSNSVALGYAMILLEAYEIEKGSKYIQGAYDQLHYVLGRNPLNICYVTGFGSNSPNNPLHNSSIGAEKKEPVWGFLVGGPDAYQNDPIITKYQKKYSLPPAKCYLDNYYSYSTNEVSVYWNSILEYIVGYLLLN